MRNRLIKFTFILAFICYSFEGLLCDYSCKNQGYCENGRCKCVPPWSGPDCSIRSCPSGFDWGGNHTLMVECSGRGKCDAQYKCVCDANFAGVACERLTCPAPNGNICSGHGKCLSVKQHSKLSFVNWKCPATTTSPPSINYYLESNDKGESWDANRIFGCECEGGYTGYDCSIKKCPLGAVKDKDKDDTTSYLVNPLKELEIKNEIKDSSGSTTVLTVAAKWSLFIKNCEDTEDREGNICKAHNITVPCNITLIELRDVIRKDGIVNDVVIYSDKDCDRLSCKGDISYGDTNPNKPEYTLNAGLVQVTDEFYDKINGYCLSTTPTPATDKSLLYTIKAPSGKLYLECSGISKCTDGMCEKCNLEEEEKNSYLLKGNAIPFIPYVRNCQVRNNDYVNNENYCDNGGIPGGPDINSESLVEHRHCVCMSDYKGNKCDVRTCNSLKGSTFFGYAYENNKGHTPEPCSGEGNCGNNGCNCRNKFTGRSCDKLSCPNQVAGWMVSNPRSECSGRGVCLFASDYLTDYDGWDKDSIGICDCFDSFTGYNCEYRKCPFGPDPLDYYNNCNFDKELPGSPFIDIYDNTNQLSKITNIHFFSVDINPTADIDSIAELDTELKKIQTLQGPFSYYTCKGDSCIASIELGSGNDGKWQRISSLEVDIPAKTAKTHFRIYFHYYCVEDLRRQTIKPEKESYIRITAEFNNGGGGGTSPKVFGINEGRIPCRECSNQGICSKTTGVCKCLGRYKSSSGMDENGNINVGRRGDCSYISPEPSSETEV